MLFLKLSLQFSEFPNTGVTEMDTSTIRLIFGVLSLFLLVWLIVKAVQGFGAVIVAGFIGGFIGFLARPSVPLIGQLPLGIVLTRGQALTGLDAILRSTAEQSFNYVCFGVLAGIGVGFILQKTNGMEKASPAHRKMSLSSNTPTPALAFCTACGTQYRDTGAFCGGCGGRRA